MPEEKTTTETTQPAAPAAETPKAPETYNNEGRVETPEETFLAEDETKTELPEEEGEETTTIEETPEEKKAREDQEAADAAAAAKEEEERKNQETTEAGKAKPGEEKLLAGKYKTKEELAAAFTELGGDPTKYDTPEKLVEAYEVRNAEFTRSRQETEEAKRISDAADAKARADALAVEQSPEKIVEKILGGLKMDEINNVEDMVKQLVPLLVANLPKPQAALDEAALAAKLEPEIRERTQRVQALATLEAEVPRLKTDMAFRKGFAAHLLAGTYERSEKGLKQAMQDFLSLARSIAGVAKDEDEKNAAAKAAAAAGTEQGATITTTPGKKTAEDDILEGIVGAYKEHDAKSRGDFS